MFGLYHYQMSSRWYLWFRDILPISTSHGLCLHYNTTYTSLNFSAGFFFFFYFHRASLLFLKIFHRLCLLFKSSHFSAGCVPVMSEVEPYVIFLYHSQCFYLTGRPVARTEMAPALGDPLPSREEQSPSGKLTKYIGPFVFIVLTP